MKEVTLPSGAILNIQSTPFAESKALYQAILKEVRGVSLGSKVELSSFIKDIFCAGFSSQEVELTLKRCLLRCTYNNLKIEDPTFEPESARGDYTTVCLRVIEENIGPFVKGLSVELNRALAMMPNVQT